MSKLKDLEILKEKLDNLEESNRYLKDRLRQVCEVALDGHWDWRLKEDYEYMDPRFWEIFGYEADEKEHKPSEWQDMIHPDDLKKSLKNLELHIKTKGKHPYWQEVRYKHKQGHWVTVICRGQVVEWDSEGHPVRMVGTHTDITAVKRVQQDVG